MRATGLEVSSAVQVLFATMTGDRLRASSRPQRHMPELSLPPAPVSMKWTEVPGRNGPLEVE